MRARAVPLVLIALLLSGCATAASPSSAGSDTPDATAPADPSATPTASRPPADAVDPKHPGTWIVTQDGMGPFVLGMPFANAITAVPGLADACTHAYSNASSTLWIASWQNPGSLDEATLYGYGRAVPATPHTPDGLGIGSTVADVLKAYPGAVHDFKNHDYLVVGHIVFGFRGDSSGDVLPGALVDSIGVATNGPEYEYCG